MRKVIASINVTLDGFCDHTAGIVDDELHQKTNELLRSADTMLFGRVTYQLMESAWPLIVKNPTGVKAVDEFAVLIDKMSKIVFSKTLKTVEWKTASVAKGDIEEEVINLKQQPGKNILVGGATIMMKLMQLGLIDEFWLWVHPIILGHGLPLFKNITDRIDLKLLETKILGSGVVVLCYEQKKK
jgi:dihydrofolate reductase